MSESTLSSAQALLLQEDKQLPPHPEQPEQRVHKKHNYTWRCWVPVLAAVILAAVVVIVAVVATRPSLSSNSSTALATSTVGDRTFSWQSPPAIAFTLTGAILNLTVFENASADTNVSLHYTVMYSKPQLDVTINVNEIVSPTDKSVVLSIDVRPKVQSPDNMVFQSQLNIPTAIFKGLVLSLQPERGDITFQPLASGSKAASITASTSAGTLKSNTNPLYFDIGSFKTQAGDIRINSTPVKTVVMQSVAGDIITRTVFVENDATRSVTLGNSTTGDIQGSIQGYATLNVNSLSGDVSLNGLTPIAASQTSIISYSGQVTLAFMPGFAGTFKAQSNSGDVTATGAGVVVDSASNSPGASKSVTGHIGQGNSTINVKNNAGGVSLQF
eukprot:jgi/Hompol1/4529/HPOL_000942-RA